LRLSGQPVKQASVALVIISAFSYYLFYYTTFLGPYGTSSDTYHLIVLIATLFFVYLVFQIYVYTLVRRRRD
jgi:hypothetical protein